MQVEQMSWSEQISQLGTLHSTQVFVKLSSYPYLHLEQVVRVEEVQVKQLISLHSLQAPVSNMYPSIQVVHVVAVAHVLQFITSSEHWIHVLVEKKYSDLHVVQEETAVDEQV